MVLVAITAGWRGSDAGSWLADPHLVPRLRMCQAVPPLSHTFVWHAVQLGPGAALPCFIFALLHLEIFGRFQMFLFTHSVGCFVRHLTGTSCLFCTITGWLCSYILTLRSLETIRCLNTVVLYGRETEDRRARKRLAWQVKRSLMVKRLASESLRARVRCCSYVFLFSLI